MASSKSPRRPSDTPLSPSRTAMASPLSPSTRTAVVLSPSKINRLTMGGSHAPGSDPHFLLDALDAYHASAVASSHHHPNQPLQIVSPGGTSSLIKSPGSQQSKQATVSFAAGSKEGNDGGPAEMDPIDFLNRHYTSEQILVAQLPGLREAVGERMERLDDRISNALQRQSETADVTRRHVQDSKASVEALTSRIHLVQEKASQSETAVLEITRDMKRLDCAKKHLQRTITTLKRLHMLIHAVEQLRLACLQKPYPDFQTAAHLVDATRLLLKHFDAYKNKVEPMNKLSQKVANLQEQLRLTLVRGFRVVAFGYEETLNLEQQTAAAKKNKGKNVITSPVVLGDPDAAPPPRMTNDIMTGGVLLIDALGQEKRRRFIIQFCQDQLREYKKDFQPMEKQVKPKERVSSFKVVEEEPEPVPLYGLDGVEKRFLWFRDRVTHVNRLYSGVFPSYWNLQYSLCRHFLVVTRDHFLQLLNGAKKDPAANNPTVLLKALQLTIKFEKETMGWLPREFGTVFTTPGDSNDKDGGKGTSSSQASTASTSTVGNAKAEDGSASTEQTPVEPLLGVASVAFEKYMRPYIQLEEQSMDEQLVQAVEDRTVDTRGELPVYTSSTGLFVYIKGSITRCNAMSRGHAFFLLYQTFQESIRKYAGVLDRKLPAQQTSQTGVVGGLNLPTISKQLGGIAGDSNTTSSVTFRIPRQEEVTICHVVSTCEYCADTVEALEDLIRDIIDDRFKSKVDMSPQQDCFYELTAKAIRILVLGLGNRIENPWRMMSNTNWSVFDMVGEESSYVHAMHEEIHPFVATIRGLLPTPHFRSFCDKFAAAFTRTYYDALTRLKKINEQATQQLLLDVYNLKTLFLKLPVLEPKNTSSISPKKQAVSTIAPALYTKMVQKEFGRIETLLKLVGTPADLLIDVFRVQWVGGSALDLQTVMALKGMKRTDQAVILERFGLDPVTALKGAHVGVTSATIVSERVQALQDRGNDVAAKVNLDLNQMRQKVDDFRKSFR